MAKTSIDRSSFLNQRKVHSGPVFLYRDSLVLLADRCSEFWQFSAEIQSYFLREIKEDM